MAQKDTRTKTDKQSSADPERETLAATIVKYAEDRYDFVLSKDDRAVAVPKDGGPGVEVKALKSVLMAEVYRVLGIAASSSVIATALDTLEGLTRVKAPTDVYLRSAQRKSSIYLDLGNHTNEVVEIAPYGWRLMSDLMAEARSQDGEDEKHDGDWEQPVPFCPVFRRSSTIRPLPIPVDDEQWMQRAGGEDVLNGREQFGKIIGLDVTDSRFHLVWGWLVASLFSEVARPALWLTGPQGSGKTTVGLSILGVVSPTDRMGGNFGKNERDDLALLGGSYIPSFDNLTRISQASNDFICRMVTGTETASRRLYTDDDLHLTTLMRTAMFTSINLPVGLREDGLERIVHLHFDRIDERDRRREGDLRAEFSEHHPRILGCLLSDVAGVLGNLHEAKSQLTSLPRMADYATILYALDLHLWMQPQYRRFLSSYRAAVSEEMEDRALNDPFTSAVLKIAERRSGWTGSLKMLLQQLDSPTIADERPSWWPQSSRALANLLRSHHESLRSVGVDVQHLGRQNDGYRVALRLVSVNRPTDGPDPDSLDDVEDAA